MILRFAICTALVFGLAAPASAAGRLYTEAMSALEEGILPVAIQKLEVYLAQGIQGAERQETLLKLGEAFLEANEPEKALKALEMVSGEKAQRLSARALVSLGRWEQVLLQVKGQQLNVEGALIEADALNALGRRSEAIALLERAVVLPQNEAVRLRLIDLYLEAGENAKCRQQLAQFIAKNSTQAQLKQYAQARLGLATGDNDLALGLFSELKAQGFSIDLRSGSTFGLAQALLEMGRIEAAKETVEAFIAEHAESAYLTAAFKLLDSIYEHGENAAALEKWAANETGERTVQAQFYNARAMLRDGKTERAEKALTQFMQAHPEHALSVEAGLLLSDMVAGASAPQVLEAAMRAALTPDALGRVEMAIGVAHFRDQEFVLAANAFRSAAKHSSQLWEKATYASALAWLNQGKEEKFSEKFKALANRHPESPFIGDLVLAEGLQQARTGDERASDSLKGFLQKYPQHPRRSDALLALAERSYFAENFAQASQYLRASSQSAPEAATAEQADYLGIFLADQAGDHKKALTLGEAFIQSHPLSKLIPEVRMKLAQIHFKNGDFARAETEFALLANENPESPLREAALFLAGQSALRSMGAGAIDRALDLFDETAKLNGPLRLNAREAQAIGQLRLGKEKEALIIYDSILGAEPELELRASVLCGKGNVLVSMAGKDPKILEQAAAVYGELAATPDLRSYWRNQALYKMGKALENQEKHAEAITAFYDVLNLQAAPGQEPEFFWFYKAGFDAARLLEEQKQWQAAIGIYQKLADVDGPRAHEAKVRINQLRLEHFIWE